MKRILSALFVLTMLLFLCDDGGSEPLRLTENLRNENVLLPHEAPDREQLALIDYDVVGEEDWGVGVIIFYDDPRTKWELDYIELYDISGDLLVVSWIDRFGVCQVAIDRALMNKDHPAIDGVLVLVTSGTGL
jgi:hypothetical protein